MGAGQYHHKKNPCPPAPPSPALSAWSINRSLRATGWPVPRTMDPASAPETVSMDGLPRTPLARCADSPGKISYPMDDGWHKLQEFPPPLTPSWRSLMQMNSARSNCSNKAMIACTSTGISTLSARRSPSGNIELLAPLDLPRPLDAHPAPVHPAPVHPLNSTPLDDPDDSRLLMNAIIALAPAHPLDPSATRGEGGDDRLPPLISDPGPC